MYFQLQMKYFLPSLKLKGKDMLSWSMSMKYELKYWSMKIRTLSLEKTFKIQCPISVMQQTLLDLQFWIKSSSSSSYIESRAKGKGQSVWCCSCTPPQWQPPTHHQQRPLQCAAPRSQSTRPAPPCCALPAWLCVSLSLHSTAAHTNSTALLLCTDLLYRHLADWESS